MPSPFSLDDSERAGLDESYRRKALAEGVLSQSLRSYPDGPVVSVPPQLRRWVLMIASDPVFCADEALVEADRGLLAVALRKVDDFVPADLVSCADRAGRDPETLAALLEHRAADDTVWLEGLWAASRRGVGRPASVPSSPLQAAALALYHPARSLGFEEFEDFSRRVAAVRGAPEVLSTLVEDLGEPWRLLFPVPQVEALVAAACTLVTA